MASSKLSTWNLMDLPVEIILLIIDHYRLSLDFEPLIVQCACELRNGNTLLPASGDRSTNPRQALRNGNRAVHVQQQALSLWREVYRQTRLVHTNRFFRQYLAHLRLEMIATVNRQLQGLKLPDLVYWRMKTRMRTFEHGKRQVAVFLEAHPDMQVSEGFEENIRLASHLRRCHPESSNLNPSTYESLLDHRRAAPQCKSRRRLQSAEELRAWWASRKQDHSAAGGITIDDIINPDAEEVARHVADAVTDE